MCCPGLFQRTFANPWTHVGMFLTVPAAIAGAAKLNDLMKGTSDAGPQDRTKEI